MSLLVVQRQVKLPVPNTEVPSKSDLRVDSGFFSELVWRKWGLDLDLFKTSASRGTNTEAIPNADDGTTASSVLKRYTTYEEVMIVPELLYKFRPVSDAEMKWVSENYTELRRRFGGEWIAVYGDELVAHGYSLEEVGEVVDVRGVDDPYFEWIPSLDAELPIIMTRL